MVKRLRDIIEEHEWIPVPGPKYGRLPPLKPGEYWSLSNKKSVPMNTVNTIQHYVTREGVDKHKNQIKNGTSNKLARVYVGRNGESYLQDGHHFYTAIHELGKNDLGKNDLPAEVFEIKTKNMD